MGASGPALPVLEMLGISKRFFGTEALQGVDFLSWAGEVHALMGENGAGKSTLMKILAGELRADSGAIRLDGRRLAARNPREVLAAGITLIHQELSLVPELTVAENIFLGAEIRRGGVGLDRGRMAAVAEQLLGRLEAGFPPTARVAELSIANQQLVEIARSLRCESRVLVMDEPTAALSDRESERLFAVIAQLRAQGTAIIYISHRMAEVEKLADRATVLRDGKVAGTMARSEIRPRRIVQLMVGRPPQELYQRTARCPGRVVLRARGLGDGGRIRDVDLEVRAGEVVGLAGLVGAGRTEVARLLFGANRAVTGTVEIEGQAVDVRTPAQAMRLGLAYVPEDRKEQGLFMALTPQANLTINLAAPTARGGSLLNHRRLRASAERAIRRFGIRVRDRLGPVLFLSGGNQQKVLLARWLLAEPRVLILDEPTRGVDIGAKGEIYRLIDELAGKGMALLLISSELAEIIALCDRVLVMREGRLMGELDGRGGAITQESVMDLAIGARACT